MKHFVKPLLQTTWATLGLIIFGVFVFPPSLADSQALVYNQSVNVAATSLPTNGVSASLGQPVTALYTVSFTNSNASTIYCAIYGSAPTLGTTPTIGSVVAVGAGATVPKYFGPTNGVNKQNFPSGVFAGCATAYRGSTGVAQTTVDVEITFL